MLTPYTPKLFTLLKQGIPKEQLLKDIIAGVIVGIVALPLAIAFATASGVSPEKGLITAVIAGFIISAFGGSRVQIGGPTGAFIIIVAGIVAQHGVTGLVLATFMAGFILIGLGLIGAGNYLKFIPYPLIVGFTSGIALIIATTQINDFFGLGIVSLPGEFIDKWRVYLGSFRQTNLWALGIAVFTLIATKFFHKITSRIPGSIIAIVLTTLMVRLLNLPVETIASKFGEIPHTLGAPHLMKIDFVTVKALIQPAFAIAFLGAIESLLSAVVADGMIGARHRPNMELIAQGGANILSALFGGIPATGAIARTATNIKNGGRTPIAGIFHALTLLFIMLFFAPLAKLIPLSCLAGILVVVAYNMSEWRQFRSILKGRGVDVAVLLTTFFLTVFFDLVIAIEVGLVLASFLFMKRMSESLKISARSGLGDEPEDEKDKLFQSELDYDSKRILVYEINGPLFFGAAQQFQDVLANIDTKPEFVIIRMRYVPFIDATGCQRLKDLAATFRAGGITMLISGVHGELKKDFKRNNVSAFLESRFVFEDVRAALAYARKHADKNRKR